MGKTSDASQNLREMTRQLAPEGKLPTVKELCALLGVSRVTLDRALTRLEGEGLIVRKHGQGIYATHPPADRTLAVLFGLDPFSVSISSYYRLLLSRITDRCREAGREVRVYVDPPYAPHGPRQRDVLEKDIAAGRVDAVLMPVGPLHVDWLQRQPVPHLILSSSTARVSGVGVRTNVAMMIGDGVRALHERGCRRIGLIDQRTGQGEAMLDESMAIFKLHLQDLGLPFEQDWCFRPIRGHADMDSFNRLGWEEVAYHGLAERFRSEAALGRERADGLLILDDMMTRGAIAALHRAGLRLGRDLQIATASNKGSSTLLGYEQDLIRMEIDVSEVADAALDLMVDLMSGRRPKRSLVTVDPVLWDEAERGESGPVRDHVVADQVGAAEGRSASALV